MSLYQLVHKHVVNCPDETYFHSPYGALTFSQFHTVLGILAAELQKQTAEKKITRLIVNINDPAYLFFVIWLSIAMEFDAVLLPALNDIEEQWKEHLVLSDHPEHHSFSVVLPVETTVRKVLQNEASKEISTFESTGRAASFVFLTSGTTAEPKWINIKHTQCEEALHVLFQTVDMPHTRKHKVLITCPLFHSYGLSSMLEYTYGGSEIILPLERSFVGPVKRVIDPEIAERISALEGVPYFYTQCVALMKKIRLPNLRHIGFGGEVVTQKLVDDLQVFFPQVSSSIRYGFTESPSVVSVQVAPLTEINVKSSGRILPCYQIKLKEINTTDRSGEIYVAGNCISGSVVLEDGYYASGDLGYISATQELIITGRKKNMIKVKGFRINPLQIEECINQSELVEECRVYLKDAKVIAEIVVNELAKFKEQQLKQFLKTRLPDYAIPEQIIQVTVLNRTESGKLKR